MDTVKCPVCGNENALDAIRCVICNHNLKQNTKNEKDGILTAKLPDGLITKQDQTPADTGTEGQIIELIPAERKSSRLKFILAAKSKEPDLEALQRNELLSKDTQPEGSPEKKYGTRNPLSGPDESSPETPGNTLPEWLRSVEFIQSDDQAGGGDGISRADLDASLGEIPEWVRKLRTKIDKHDTETPIGEQPLPLPDNRTSPPIGVETPKIDRVTISPTPIKNTEPGLIDAVTAYVTGLITPRKLMPDRSRRLSRISWGVIGLAIISLLATLIWSGSSVAIESEPATMEMAAMSSLIESISSESVVLVAMDYDLPLAGEIENAALPVLVDLMSKQANLVFISTRPVGPAMSNHLVDSGLNWQPDYPVEKIFISAYLPGGATGLLRFAIDPQDTLPIGANGAGLWLAPQMATIHRPSDFSMLLLLTDSSEAGKDWLEQVQPRLEDTPLFMVASSQAAPILRPYLESGQIKALVEGISDAANYERVHLQTMNNQLLLKAYHGGLLFMAVLLACVIALSIVAPGFPISPNKRKHNNANK
ncbi:MAG: hypothetical protein WCF08_02915 [Anaerolineaceae bacterium]